MPSQLEAVRKQLGSFGLDTLQTDRALSNITAKLGEARRGSQRLAESFRTLGVESLNIESPLEVLNQISANFANIPVGQRLEALRLTLGERFAIPVGGLLATPGQFEAEIERVTEKFSAFSDTAVRINKNLDQAFIDLSGIIRIEFQNVVADHAVAIRDLVEGLEKAVPAIAAFTGAVASFALNNRGGFGGSLSGAIGGAAAGVGIQRSLKLISAIRSAGLGGAAGAVGAGPLGAGVGVVIGLLAGLHIDSQRSAREELERFNRALEISNRIASGDGVPFINLENSLNEVRRQFEVASKELSRLQEEQDNLVQGTLPGRNEPGFLAGLFGTGSSPGAAGASELSLLGQGLFDIQKQLSGVTLARVYEGTAEGIKLASDEVERLSIVLNPLQEEWDRINESVKDANALHTGLVDILDSEIDALNQVLNEWRGLGAGIQEATNRRDILQLQIDLQELVNFNRQAIQSTADLVRATLNVELANLEKNLTLQRQRNMLLMEGVGAELVSLQISQDRAKLEEDRITRAERFQQLSNLELFRLEGLRIQSQTIGTPSPLNPITDDPAFVRSAIGRVLTVEEANQLREAYAALVVDQDKLTNSQQLYTMALDRALMGISDSLADVVISLAKGEEVFNSFLSSLANVADQLLTLFINAGLTNISTRLGISGFQRGGLLKGFGIVGEGGAEIIDAKTPTRVYPNDYFSSSSGSGGNTYNIQAIEANTIRALLSNQRQEMRVQFLDDIRTNGSDVQESIRALLY